MSMTRSDLRKLFEHLFKADGMLDAFIIDYFLEVYTDFSVGMSRTEKINRLFVQVTPVDIQQILQREYPEAMKPFQGDESIGKRQPILETTKQIHSLLKSIETEEAEIGGGLSAGPISIQTGSRRRQEGAAIEAEDASLKLSAASTVAEPVWPYEPVPPTAVRLFRWCWQLEDWLRLMVYVELRAAMIDWESAIKKILNRWPPPSYEKDKKLHHMSTAHQASLSYLSFSELWSIIDANWFLFEPYFPPHDNVRIKIEEVKAIRNRIADLREPHPQDEARLELFLRDLKPGLRQFCIRYTIPKVPSERDPLTDYMNKVWPNLYYGIELLCADKSWLYAPGRYRQQPIMNACIELLTHKRYRKDSFEGVIYALTFHPTVGKEINALNLLESTKTLHKEIIHFFMSDTLMVTIPAVYGIERTGDIICSFLDIAKGLSDERHSYDSAPVIPKAKRQEWPEYVLWPNHMLNLFSSEMREPVIDLS